MRNKINDDSNYDFDENTDFYSGENIRDEIDEEYDDDDNNRVKGQFWVFIRRIVFIIALCIFLWSAFNLYSMYREYKVGEDEYAALQDLVMSSTQAPTMTVVPPVEETDETEVSKDVEVKASETTVAEQPVAAKETTVTAAPTKASTDPTVPNMSDPTVYNPDFNTLRALNPHVVAWIMVPGTMISYPIVQGTDNVYYLRHTYQNTYNIAGSIFLDSRITEGLDAKNPIIYGHNQKNRKMFGTLQDFRNYSFYEVYHKIFIYTSNDIRVYNIFSAYETGPTSKAYNYTFPTDDDYQAYIDWITQSSLYNTGVEMTVSDKMVTLSTCTDDTKNRFVVHGKLVDVLQRAVQ